MILNMLQSYSTYGFRLAASYNDILIKCGNFASKKPSIWFVPGISLTFAQAKDNRRERKRSLLLFQEMNADTQIQEIGKKVNVLIGQEPGTFLVEVRIKPTNNIKVFIDADEGISIERLVQYNRRLYKELEESGMYPGGDFSLEVSSPGLDEPLKLTRQYQKNIGRYVEVTLKDGIRKEGKLLVADDTGIVIEEEKGKNKKKELISHAIPFDDIKTTKIQIKF
jgi:ribosome maturation factor RimP